MFYVTLLVQMKAFLGDKRVLGWNKKLYTIHKKACIYSRRVESGIKFKTNMRNLYNMI